MHVKTVMDIKGYDVFSVSPDDTLQAVTQLFITENIGFAIVGDLPDNVVGTISERDICHAMSNADGVGSATQIKEIMTKNINYCDIP